MAVSAVVPAEVFLVVSVVVSVGVSVITVSALPSVCPCPPVASRNLYHSILEHLFAFISVFWRNRNPSL